MKKSGSNIYHTERQRCNHAKYSIMRTIMCDGKTKIRKNDKTVTDEKSKIINYVEKKDEDKKYLNSIKIKKAQDDIGEVIDELHNIYNISTQNNLCVINNEKKIRKWKEHAPINHKKDEKLEYKQVMGVESLNTHFFDGKMEYIISFFKNYIDDIHNIPKDKKMVMFSLLREYIIRVGKSECIKNYDLIIETYDKYDYIETSGNYDSINKLYSEDLLYIISENIIDYNNLPLGGEITLKDSNFEILKLLIDQLEEMSSGLCPQGRITRLLQVLTLKL